MSISGFLFSVFGIHVGPTDEERQYRHQEWRNAIHEHRGEMTKAIGTARHSRKVSDQAIASLREAVRMQETDGNLRRIEMTFIEKLRGDDAS